MCTNTSRTNWLLDPFASQPGPQASVRRSVVQVLLEGLATGVAVQIGTLPIMWKHFGEVSWMGIPANAALVWATPLLTTAAVYFEVLSSFLEYFPGGMYALSLVASPLGWLAEGFLWGVMRASQLPVNSSISLPGELENWHFLAWWLGWIALVFGWRRRRVGA